MKVNFNGKKSEFSQVLMDWIIKNAKTWKKQGIEDSEVDEWRVHSFDRIMGGKGPKHLLDLLRLMTTNRYMFEDMIAFASRYSSALEKATTDDVKETLDLIEVMKIMKS